MTVLLPPAPPGRVEAAFLLALPRIELHLRVCFRGLRCPGRREDAAAEAVALAWSWWLRLARAGRDPATFVSALAAFAARAVRSGRRLCGQERAKDVLSLLAQARHGFVVRPLAGGLLPADVLEEALRDNTQTPPDAQAVFRLDFRRWRASRGERDRRLIDDLMAGERTGDVAREHGLSAARVSQLRRELRDDWARFCADPADGRHGHVSMSRDQACPG